MMSLLPTGDDNATKCYEPLGCLEISEKWYSLTRPVNMMPQPRQVINTQFILRTRKAYETVGSPTYKAFGFAHDLSDVLVCLTASLTQRKPPKDHIKINF